MRVAKAEWLASLRALEGCSDADIRYNETVGRWEFIFRGADNIPRSQFFGWFHRPVDPVTGLHPFRDLDDEAMREAIANLEKTYVANPWDGAGTPRKEVQRRIRFNADMRQKRYMECGHAFADMAAERGRRIRGAPLIHVPVVIRGEKVYANARSER